MATVPMVSDVDPATDPHAIIFFDVIQKSLERHKPAGAAQKSTVQPNRHHLRSLLSFGVQHIKRIPQIGKKMLTGQTLDNFARNSHVLSLSLFVDLLVVNPPPAVGGNFVP